MASGSDFDFRLRHSRTHSSAYNSVITLSLLHCISSHLLMYHLGLHVLKHRWQVAGSDRFIGIFTSGILAYRSPLALSGVRGTTIITRYLLQGKTIGACDKSSIFPLFIVVHKGWLVLAQHLPLYRNLLYAWWILRDASTGFFDLSFYLLAVDNIIARCKLDHVRCLGWKDLLICWELDCILALLLVVW